jgi:hypothetical protein
VSVFIVVLDGGVLWHLQKFLQYIKCITLEFPTPPVYCVLLIAPVAFYYTLQSMCSSCAIRLSVLEEGSGVLFIFVSSVLKTMPDTL